MNDAPPLSHKSREEFLTARQLAAILQVSEATVRRLAHNGRIPSIRITPHLIRFHLKAVRAALLDGSKNPRQNSGDRGAESAQLPLPDLQLE